MKKIISLGLVLFALAGCNTEKRYEKDLNGTWTADNYLLNNINAWAQFQQQYKNYTLTFTSSGSFTESYLSDTTPVVNHGSYHFINYNQGIALDDTLYIPIDSTVYDSVYERQYTLFDLNGASVQFRTDTTDLYLQKQP